MNNMLHLHVAQSFLLCAFLMSGRSIAQETQAGGLRFTDVTVQSGITFVHTHGGSGMGYIVEGMATGLATFDYDNDGYTDIYFLNGSALKGTEADTPAKNALYRNNGDWTFTDVTEQAGVGDEGYGLGVSVADYDGDGDQDLYINNFGPNVLYRNNGDRTFTDVTQAAGVGNGSKVGAGVGFLDIEGDGDLDLYVANYVDFTYENHVPIVINGKRFQAGPQYYSAVADSLFRNEGNGTFTDVSQSSGIAAVTGPGMGLVCADLDNDSDCDIYVCNDGQPNFLFINDGTGHFEESGLLLGAACDFSGKANSSMGVDCSDFDNDGLLDLMVTNYQAEMPVLYHNLGDGLFEDATSRCRIPHSLFPHVNWGTALVDFDNDGDQDIFIACGHFDRIEEIDDRTSQKVANYLLLNEGGKFVDVSSLVGEGLKVVETSRGAAFEDFDNDGDIDAVIVNSHTKPTLLRNDADNNNSWIELQLQYAGQNLDAVGAVVLVGDNTKPPPGNTIPTTQMAAVMSGRGYQSHFGSRQHFGVGQAKSPVTVRVRWPNGQVQSLQVPCNQLTRIKFND
ncbi:MAG: CRTAC1 family protein [Planctomycetales bacterium]|nr:CRTAC1 family protein [Planctomycetales bacterium]